VFLCFFSSLSLRFVAMELASKLLLLLLLSCGTAWEIGAHEEGGGGGGAAAAAAATTAAAEAGGGGGGGRGIVVEDEDVVVMYDSAVFNGSLGLVGEERGSSSAVRRRRRSKEEYLRLFVEETQWYNDLVLGLWMPSRWRDKMPHTLQTFLRNYVAGLVVYFMSGALWCWYVYKLKGHHFFPNGKACFLAFSDRFFFFFFGGDLNSSAYKAFLKKKRGAGGGAGVGWIVLMLG
jgi:hypothetical protein